MIPDCTLSTAIYCSNNPIHAARTLQETIDVCSALLSIPVYLAIFGDKDTIPLIRKKRSEFGLTDMTVFYEIEKHDLWSFQYLDVVRENRSKYWPSRDSRNDEYIHLLQCNKADFVLQTIERNPFQTTKFGWVDAFLGKDTIRICENYDPLVLPRILSQISDKFHIQILNTCDKRFKHAEHKMEYYREYRWVVCGGFYTCGIDAGKKILPRVKEIFVETTRLGYGHGEEMLYLEILDEFDEYIHKAYGDYGQMWNNFIYPTKNLHYIYFVILHTYLMHGQYEDFCKCAEAVIEAVNLHISDIHPETYLKLLVDYCNVIQHIDADKYSSIKKYVFDLCSKHPALKHGVDRFRSHI
jgi:hypothetical protein